MLCHGAGLPARLERYLAVPLEHAAVSLPTLTVIVGSSPHVMAAMSAPSAPTTSAVSFWRCQELCPRLGVTWSFVDDSYLCQGCWHLNRLGKPCTNQMRPLGFLAAGQFGELGEGASSSALELPPVPWGLKEGAWESPLLARCWLSHLG